MSSMNQNPLEQELREKAWRRALTAEEHAQLEALLTANPQARADWEADGALSMALARLPEKPAPSNLAARVLAEIGREDLTTAGTRKTNWLGWLGSWGWVLRLAVVVGVLAIAAFVAQRHDHTDSAPALAAVAVTKAASMPSTEELENFDSIYALPPPFPGADEELIALMK